MSGVRWENSEVAQLEMREGSKVAIGKSQEEERGSEMARQERWESSEVARWEISCFIQGWGMQGETKI